MIKISGLNKYFNRGKQNEIRAINGVSLDIGERGMVAVFGKSGCGKTTLLNAIGGLEGCDSGEISVDGRPMSPDADELRAECVGYIFQNYNLLKDESCFDNVAHALMLCGVKDRAVIRERTIAALRAVGMEKYERRTPDTLSGGQQQRIAIARAIVKNPKIILADEPTGNLDEANTLMIMELLRAISRDRLVILVTHEEALVRRYCDRIIELSDGAVTAVSENETNDEYTVNPKGGIYLGELKKQTSELGGVTVEHYGEPIEESVRLRIVNKDGKIYLSVDGGNVCVIDKGCETKLIDGLPMEVHHEKQETMPVDLEELRRPLHGRGAGRLFGFFDSVKQGYRSNFSNPKRGKRALVACLLLFSIVFVFVSAVFSRDFVRLADADEAHSHNTFYVYTGSYDISDKLNSALSHEDSGIDFVSLKYSMPEGDERVSFSLAAFETFNALSYSEAFSSNAVYLDTTVSDRLNTLCGKGGGITDGEVIISSALADALIESSPLGYIDEYDDLIGITLDYFSYRVAGVVESDEAAVYFTPTALSEYIISQVMLNAYRGGDFGLDIAKGECVIATGSYVEDESKIPKVGDTVVVSGRELTVAAVRRYYATYEHYLSDNGIEKSDIDAYAKAISGGELSVGDEEYAALLDKIYYDYLDYYYSELGAYIRSNHSLYPHDINGWYFCEKGIDAAAFRYINDGDEYFSAYCYKKANGNYPSRTDFVNNYYDNSTKLSDVLYDAYMSYGQEFQAGDSLELFYNGLSCLVSDSDYIAVSKGIGNTTEGLGSSVGNNYYYTDGEGVLQSAPLCYTAIHSNNPALTERWLRGELYGYESVTEELPPILTPSDIYELLTDMYRGDIIAAGVGLLAMLTVMSICMYFIMRSSLLSEIRSIGIYRAIGVRSGNIILRYFANALSLVTLTVLPGYIISSAFLFLCKKGSAAVGGIFFYPIWEAIAVLALLCGITLLFGILPIMLLLRKTPGEILAKYDI